MNEIKVAVTTIN